MRHQQCRHRTLLNSIRIVTASLFCLAFIGCRTITGATDNSAAEKSLAYHSDAGTKNVLAIFTAPNPVGNSPVGIANDASDIFAGIKGLDQSFHTYINEAATAYKVGSDLTFLSDAEHLSSDGTMFIYIAGHGAPTAQAQMNDGTFVDYNQIATSIRAGRKGAPLKRLVVMIFGCFSGSWVDVVRGYDNSKVAEQVYILTSSASNQYSMFTGTNSRLMDAFRNVLASYQNSPSGVTMGQFFEEIKRNVPDSTPQYYVNKPELLNESLFSKDVLDLYYLSIEQGIMPSPTDFAAGKRTPSKDTIAQKRDVPFDANKNCKMGVLQNSAKEEFCSGWNNGDSKGAYAYKPVNTNATSKCYATWLYWQMDSEQYKKFYEHCDGILRQKSSL